MITSRRVRIMDREPRLLSDGITTCKEAFLQINTAPMRQDFIKLLMHHISEGHIQVRVATEVRRVRAGAEDD